MQVISSFHKHPNDLLSIMFVNPKGKPNGHAVMASFSKQDDHEAIIQRISNALSMLVDNREVVLPSAELENQRV